MTEKSPLLTITLVIKTRITVAVQSLCHVWLFETPWTAASQTLVSSTISWSLLKFTTVEWVMLTNHLSLCHPLLICLRSFPVSGSFPMSQLFISGGQGIRDSASPSSSNEYSGLISFGIDQFDLLAVQGTLKSLLQHHNLKSSILWHSAFFMVQLLHPYKATAKTTAFHFFSFYLPWSNGTKASWWKSKRRVKRLA